MPAGVMLARFLRNPLMDLLHAARKRLSLEDRIDELSRLALVILLIATLGFVL